MYNYFVDLKTVIELLQQLVDNKHRPIENGMYLHVPI